MGDWPCQTEVRVLSEIFIEVCSLQTSDKDLADGQQSNCKYKIVFLQIGLLLESLSQPKFQMAIKL